MRLRLTRRELCELAARINAALPSFPEGSAERATALANLPNIRAVLARAAPKPG
jgi:hypothetical protein